MFPPPKRFDAGFDAAFPPKRPPEDAAGVPLVAPPPNRPPEAGADVLGVDEPAFPKRPPEVAGVEDAPAAGLAPKRPPPVDPGVPEDAAGAALPKSPPAGFWAVFCPNKPPPEAGVPLLDPAAAPPAALPPREPKEKLGVPLAAAPPPPKRPPDAGAEVAGVEPLFEVGVALGLPKLKDIALEICISIGSCLGVV